MFVGHYGVSFAASRADRRLPLWLTFLSVQWVDVMWAIFVLTGVEKVRIVPGITATNPLDLYYMPFTHSLTASLGWSVLAALAFAWLKRPAGQWKSAALLGATVFSHWVLDFIVHRPDLPLYDNTAKVGLSLWNYPAPAFLLEAAILFAGLFFYWRCVPTRGRKILLVVFGLFMLLIQASVFFGPPPSSSREIAMMALISYAAFAWGAYRITRVHAEPVPEAGEPS
jgi:hypothetical protein